MIVAATKQRTASGGPNVAAAAGCPANQPEPFATTNANSTPPLNPEATAVRKARPSCAWPPSPASGPGVIAPVRYHRNDSSPSMWPTTWIAPKISPYSTADTQSKPEFFQTANGSPCRSARTGRNEGLHRLQRVERRPSTAGGTRRRSVSRVNGEGGMIDPSAGGFTAEEPGREYRAGEERDQRSTDPEGRRVQRPPAARGVRGPRLLEPGDPVAEPAERPAEQEHEPDEQDVQPRRVAVRRSTRSTRPPADAARTTSIVNGSSSRKFVSVFRR